MALSLQSFTQWTNQQLASAQASCSTLLDLSVGSALRALMEASAGLALWMQWLVLQVLATTRAQTSVGADLDSFFAQFSTNGGFARLGATYATGTVTLARFTPTNSALIVPYFSAVGAVNATGSQVKTADGSVTFGVTTNTAHSLWNAGLGGYLIPAGTASAVLPVQSLTIGSPGNVQAATITLLATAVSGIDTVSNAAAFANGLDPESDAAALARFQLWIDSRSLGVEEAIQAAVVSVQQNLTCTIAENVDTMGGYKPGNFVVTVDDGSGAPSAGTLALVTAAVEAARGLAITYSVRGPTEIVAAVSFTLTAASGYVKANLIPPISAALTAFINALPMGAPLPYSRVAQVIYDAAPGVANVTGLTLNSGTADLGGAPAQCVRAGAITIS